MKIIEECEYFKKDQAWFLMIEILEEFLKIKKIESEKIILNTCQILGTQGLKFFSFFINDSIILKIIVKKEMDSLSYSPFELYFTQVLNNDIKREEYRISRKYDFIRDELKQ